MNVGKTPFKNDLAAVEIPCLESLKSSNILITGATGLIGSALVELLLLYAEQYEFAVYAGCRSRDRFVARFGDNAKNLFFFQLDVTESLNAEIHFDYIIHAASGASPHSFSSDPIGVMKANFLGTSNLLDYGVTHGLRKFLYISTGEVYGEGCPDKWTEKDSGYVDSMSSRSCYPSSKRAAETLCAAYANQYPVDVFVARLSHTYGPCFTATDNRVYAQFIRNVLNNEDIVLKSKGLPFRSWLYVVDCVAALLFILIKGDPGEAYNVANEESNVSIRQLAELIAELADRKVVFDLPKDAGADVPIAKAIFDTQKIEKLGWRPVTALQKGMLHTLRSL